MITSVFSSKPETDSVAATPSPSARRLADAWRMQIADPLRAGPGLWLIAGSRFERAPSFVGTISDDQINSISIISEQIFIERKNAKNVKAYITRTRDIIKYAERVSDEAITVVAESLIQNLEFRLIGHRSEIERLVKAQFKLVDDPISKELQKIWKEQKMIVSL